MERSVYASDRIMGNEKICVVESEEQLCSLRLKPEVKHEFAERLQKKCIGFIYVHEQQALAWYWAKLASSGIVWHDKYPIQNSEIFLFAAFVEPSDRGNGLYRLLSRVAFSHFSSNEDTIQRKFRILVENRNMISMHINKSLGFSVSRNNYLVKLFRKTCFSLYTNPFRVYLVLKYEQRNNL